MGKITTKKERIFYYDFLRTIAIIGIVSCHVAANFLTNTSIINSFGWNFAVVIDCFRDFSIPIFVMLTGSLLINKNYSLSVFVKKRLNRVYLPYLFWLLIYIIASYFLVSKNIGLNTIVAIAFGHSGSIGIILWFVWMILLVYLAVFILNKIIYYIKFKYSKSNSNFINNFDLNLIKILVCIFILYIIAIRFTGFDPNANKLVYYLSFIGYAVLGYYLSNTDFTNGKIVDFFRFSKNKILIASLIISIITYAYYINQVLALSSRLGYFQSYSYFSLILFILAINVFLFFRYFEESNQKSIKKLYLWIKNGIIGKIINSLSKTSYGIYLVHYIIIKVLYNSIFNKIGINDYHIIGIPIVFIVTLVISWLIITILSKIPYLSKFSGSG